jgi:hypothetical protein
MKRAVGTGARSFGSRQSGLKPSAAGDLLRDKAQSRQVAGSPRALKCTLPAICPLRAKKLRVTPGAGQHAATRPGHTAADNKGNGACVLCGARRSRQRDEL